jgi:hypothetical protein
MKTRGKPKNVPSRSSPLFPPHIQSVYNRVRLEHPRTTNRAELWHRKLNRLASLHPGIYHITNYIYLNSYIFYLGLHKFITIVRKIQAEVESQIEMLIFSHQIK